MQTTPHRVALYARVSTTDQTAENQILELRGYSAARGWTVTADYGDTGISGSTTSRPQLDAMIKAARRRQIDAIVTGRDRRKRSAPCGPPNGDCQELES